MWRLTGSWYFYEFQANFLLFGLCAALGLISSWHCWGCSSSLYYSWIVAVDPCGTVCHREKLKGGGGIFGRVG